MQLQLRKTIDAVLLPCLRISSELILGAWSGGSAIIAVVGFAITQDHLIWKQLGMMRYYTEEPWG